MIDKLSVQINNLVVGYGGPPVLQGVSLEVTAGEFLGIIGPNGSGKTTLLRSVARVLGPTSGAVLIGDRNVYDIPAREFARDVAVVPQDTVPAFDFTALEIVLMGRSPHLGRFQAERARDVSIAEKAMRETGTSELSARLFASLSGGERQRVVIARALAQQPRIILLDEPTSHLDINYQFEILNLIRRLNHEAGITVLAVLHDLNLAAAYCDRLVLVGGGEVQAVGAPAEVLTAENVKRVYGAEVWVRRHPTSGRPYVIAGIGRPVEEAQAERFDRRPRVHVICGGGTGAPIFAKLLRRGYEVTAGVLNRGDTDQEAAEALSLEYASAPPFTPIPEDAADRNAQMAAAADAIVLSDVPFGTWNLPNLTVAASAVDSGARVILLRPETIRQRDFTGGDAMDIIEALQPQCESASTLDELAALVENAVAQG